MPVFRLILIILLALYMGWWGFSYYQQHTHKRLLEEQLEQHVVAMNKASYAGVLECPDLGVNWFPYPTHVVCPMFEAKIKYGFEHYTLQLHDIRLYPKEGYYKVTAGKQAEAHLQTKYSAHDYVASADTLPSLSIRQDAKGHWNYRVHMPRKMLLSVASEGKQSDVYFAYPAMMPVWLMAPANLGHPIALLVYMLDEARQRTQ